MIEDLTADNLTQHVIKTCTINASHERTKELVSGLIQHLHDYVREVNLKPGEWETGWQYLTQVRGVLSVMQLNLVSDKDRGRLGRTELYS